MGIRDEGMEEDEERAPGGGSVNGAGGKWNKLNSLLIRTRK